MYFCCFTLLSVGFGDVHAITPIERCFAIILMCVGSAYLALLISSVSDVLTQLQSKANALKSLLTDVDEWSRDRALPVSLRSRLFAFFETFSKKGTLAHEDSILHELSCSMQNEVVAHNRAVLISKLNIFKGLEASLITSLVSEMRPVSIMAGERLFTEGEPANEIFFITNGTIECSVADPTLVLQFHNISTLSVTLSDKSHISKEQLIFGLQDARLQRSAITQPPALLIPQQHSSAASSRSESDSDSAVSATEENLFAAPPPLLRTASFCVHTAAPSNGPSVLSHLDPLVALTSSGITYTTPINPSCTQYSFAIYTNGWHLGDETSLSGEGLARSFSARATTPCEIHTINTTSPPFQNLLKKYPAFANQLFVAAAAKNATVLQQKKDLAAVLHTLAVPKIEPTDTAIARSEPEPFPHVRDLIQESSKAYSCLPLTRILPYTTVNDLRTLTSTIPTSLFLVSTTDHVLYRTIRPVLLQQSHLNGILFFKQARIHVSRFFGVAPKWLVGPISLQGAPFTHLPEVEDIESHFALFARGIVAPTTAFKIFFDCLIMIAVIISSFTIPYTLGFDIIIAQGTALWWLDTFVNYLFIVDLFVHFRVGYFDAAGNLITTPSRVARNYLNSSFAIDCLSSIPC